jgi:hypothetical protein
VSGFQDGRKLCKLLNDAANTGRIAKIARISPALGVSTAFALTGRGMASVPAFLVRFRCTMQSYPSCTFDPAGICEVQNPRLDKKSIEMAVAAENMRYPCSAGRAM